MQETFKEIVSEISVRKVEMKSKSKPRLNLFENETDALFSINSFTSASEYWQHLNSITARIKLRIEAENERFQDLIGSLVFLENLHSDLRDIKSSYLPENNEIILGSIKAEGLIKYRFDNSHVETLKKKRCTLPKFRERSSLLLKTTS